jgi:hypothetical protein
VKAAGVKKGDGILDVAMSDGSAEVMLLSRQGARSASRRRR